MPNPRPTPEAVAPFYRCHRCRRLHSWPWRLERQGAVRAYCSRQCAEGDHDWEAAA